MVLSKFIYLVPLNNKSARDVSDAFESIFANGVYPRSVRSDRGREFLNVKVESVFKKYKINFYTAFNNPKANIAERAIRTIKNNFFRYLQHNKSDRYIDNLQNFADSYNSTEHSSIGIPPKDVNTTNENMISWILYWPKQSQVRKYENKNKLSKFKFKIGSYVRISTLKPAFSKESTTPNWSREVFKIKSRMIRDGIPIYMVSDFNSLEIIRGRFYQQELQKVIVKDSQLWNIDKILKTRKLKSKKKQVLVRWENYGPENDSWIDIDEVKELDT